MSNNPIQKFLKWVENNSKDFFEFRFMVSMSWVIILILSWLIASTVLNIALLFFTICLLITQSIIIGIYTRRKIIELISISKFFILLIVLFKLIVVLF